MDHLNRTPNFTLQHLQFLVIDKADRLLAQSFQDWLTQVLAAMRPSAHVEAGDNIRGSIHFLPGCTFSGFFAPSPRFIQT